jgi:hypothetical protein
VLTHTNGSRHPTDYRKQYYNDRSNAHVLRLSLPRIKLSLLTSANDAQNQYLFDEKDGDHCDRYPIRQYKKP